MHKHLDIKNQYNELRCSLNAIVKSEMMEASEITDLALEAYLGPVIINFINDLPNPNSDLTEMAKVQKAITRLQMRDWKPQITKMLGTVKAFTKQLLVSEPKTIDLEFNGIDTDKLRYGSQTSPQGSPRGTNMEQLQFLLRPRDINQTQTQPLIINQIEQQAKLKDLQTELITDQIRRQNSLSPSQKSTKPREFENLVTHGGTYKSGQDLNTPTSKVSWIQDKVNESPRPATQHSNQSGSRINPVQIVSPRSHPSIHHGLQIQSPTYSQVNNSVNVDTGSVRGAKNEVFIRDTNSGHTTRKSLNDSVREILMEQDTVVKTKNLVKFIPPSPGPQTTLDRQFNPNLPLIVDQDPIEDFPMYSEDKEDKDLLTNREYFSKKINTLLRMVYADWSKYNTIEFNRILDTNDLTMILASIDHKRYSTDKIKKIKNLILSPHSSNVDFDNLRKMIRTYDRLEYAEISFKGTTFLNVQLNEFIPYFKQLSVLHLDLKNTAIIVPGLTKMRRALEDNSRLTELSIRYSIPEGNNDCNDALTQIEKLGIWAAGFDDAYRIQNFDLLHELIPKMGGIKKVVLEEIEGLEYDYADDPNSALSEDPNYSYFLRFIGLTRVWVNYTYDKMRTRFTKFNNLTFLVGPKMVFKLVQNLELLNYLPLLRSKSIKFSALYPKLKSINLKIGKLELKGDNHSATSKKILEMLQNLDKNLLRKTDVKVYASNPQNMQAIDLKPFPEIENLQIWVQDINNVEHVCQQIDLFPNLKSLALSFVQCNLDLDSVRSLGKTISKLHKLIEFEINVSASVNDALNDEKMDFICQAIGSLYNLYNITINLSYNASISNDTLIGIAKSVAILSKLRKVSINMNYTEATNIGFESLFTALRRLERLQILKIWFSNRVDDKTYQLFARLLLELRYLRTLKVYGDTVERDGVISLYNALGKCRLYELSVEFYDPQMKQRVSVRDLEDFVVQAQIQLETSD